MLLNEIVENTKSMRLTLKDISSVAKDARVIKLLTIRESDTFATGSVIVFHLGATSPLPHPTFMIHHIYFLFPQATSFISCTPTAEIKFLQENNKAVDYYY